MMRVETTSGEINTTWFKHSEQIWVYKKDRRTLDYYLVNRYDRNAKYELKLQIRASIAYFSPSFDVGALVIPYKYRFGFERNGVHINSDVSSSFNIGAYGGLKITNYHVMNRAGTYVQNSRMALRIGPFFNISTTGLDNVNTTVGSNPYAVSEKQNITVFSYGFGPHDRSTWISVWYLPGKG